MQKNNFKSGFVAIIGRPNVGKSTLLNQILKEKIAIVSPKAQTTRNKIQGIYTTDNEQIIFIDTPGVHKSKNELGNVMNDFAISSLAGTDAIIYLIDATSKISTGDEFIIETLKKVKIPVFLVANKVDLMKNQIDVIENVDTYKEKYNFKGGITISAASNFNIDKLLKMIVDILPNGPMYYPEDQLLDQPERFVVSEIIREKILLNTEEEVPHSVAVTIERFKDVKNVTEIFATIIVERQSQKKIIIGKNGSMIKKIGTDARLDINRLLGCKIHLDLFVKVEENWRNKKFHLKEFGYVNDDM